MGAFFSLFSSSSERGKSTRTLLTDDQENKGVYVETKGHDEDVSQSTLLDYGQKNNPVTLFNDTTTGDGKQKNSIITSHQGRMRCFLNIMLNEVGAKKFKNGAIVKVTISRTGCTIELVYEGELAGTTNDSEYYNFNKFTLSGELTHQEDRERPKVLLCELTLENTKSKFGLNNGDIGDNTYIFYLVRHGDAEHNEKKRNKQKNMELDTNLTFEGERQAATAGKFLKKELEKINPNDIRYYTSDLHRTMQTMAYIMHRLGVEQSSAMTVLPCNHEIDSTKPPCKNKKISKAILGRLIQRENETLKKSEKSREVEIPIIGDNGDPTKYAVNWKLYNDDNGRDNCFTGGETIFVTTALRNMNKLADRKRRGDMDVSAMAKGQIDVSAIATGGGSKTQKRKKTRRKGTKCRRGKKTHNKRKTKRSSKKRKLKVTKSQKLKKLNEGINH